VFLAVSVTTYGDGHILASVLSGVKSVVGSGEFTTIVVITFLLGTLFVAYGTLLGTFQLHSTIKNIVSHYFILIILFYALLVPKEDVLIYDAIDSSPGSTTVVEDVPYGISMLLWFSNTIEKGLTNIFDNAFNTPFGYSGYGYNYYNMLLNELTNIKSANPYLNASMTNYVKDCFFYDVIAGDRSVDQVLNSNNVWQSMSPVSSTSVITTIKCDPLKTPNHCLSNGGSKATSTVDCSTAYTYIDGLLNDSATAALNDIDKKIINGAVNLPTVAQTILNVSATSESLVRQAIVSNYLPEAYKNAIAMLSNSEITQYSTAMAEVQARQQMLTSGEMAKRYLPVIRWILNGMVYGGFPLLFIVALTPIGPKAIQGYMGLGLAQISWGPLFSILNNIVYTKTVDEFSTVLGNFSPSQLTTIHNATENLIALSGQVAWLIPVATLSIAGIGFLGAGSLISSIGSVAQSSALSAGAQASGLSGVKQAEIAGYMQGASVTGYSMSDLMYAGNAWSAFRTSAMANPSAVPGTLDLAGPGLGFTEGLMKVGELGVYSGSPNPAAPAMLGASAVLTKANDKANVLGLSPTTAGKFEQNPVLTKNMLEGIKNLSPEAKKALEGALVPGGLDSIALAPDGTLIGPLVAYKQDGGLRKTIHASPDGKFFTITDGVEDSIAYTGITTNKDGQIIAGAIRGNFNIGGREYSGTLTIDGSNVKFMGIDPKSGQQVSWSGDIGAPLNTNDIRPSSGVISSDRLKKLYETGNYTGPVDIAGINVDNAIVHREGDISHISGVISPQQVKDLSKILNDPQKSEGIRKTLGLTAPAIRAIHNAARKGQGLIMTTTQRSDGTYANTQFLGGASAIVNNSGTYNNAYTRDSTWSNYTGTKKFDYGYITNGIFNAQQLRQTYNNVVETMGQDHPMARAIKSAADYAEKNHTEVAAQWRIDPNTGQITDFIWNQNATGHVGNALIFDRNMKQMNIGPHYNVSPFGWILNNVEGILNELGVDNTDAAVYSATAVKSIANGALLGYLFRKVLGGTGGAASSAAGTASSVEAASNAGRTAPLLQNLDKFFQGIGRSYLPAFIIFTPAIMHGMQEFNGGQPQS